MKKTTSMLIVLSFAFVLLKPAFVLAVDDDANRRILKDAVTGAVTGAVATEATKDEKKDTATTAAAQTAQATEEKHHHKGHHHDDDDDDDKDHDKDHKKFVKDKKRPHGWDQGKKTGWGGGNEPPGLEKKHDK